MRLFIASSLPDKLLGKVLSYQPPSNEGVRLSRPDLLHMTVQFIGEADPNAVDKALSEIDFDAFTTNITKTGIFAPKKGKRILWMGLELNQCMQSLHQAVSASLARHDINIDSRHFVPHITLARCKRSISEDYIQSFLDQEVATTPYLVDRLHLYHSHSKDGTLYYDILESYWSR